MGSSRDLGYTLFCPDMVLAGGVMTLVGVSFSMEVYYNEHIRWLELAWRWFLLQPGSWQVLAGLLISPWFIGPLSLVVNGFLRGSISTLSHPDPCFLCSVTPQGWGEKKPGLPLELPSGVGILKKVFRASTSVSQIAYLPKEDNCPGVMLIHGYSPAQTVWDSSVRVMTVMHLQQCFSCFTLGPGWLRQLKHQPHTLV